MRSKFLVWTPDTRSCSAAESSVNIAPAPQSRSGGSGTDLVTVLRWITSGALPGREFLGFRKREAYYQSCSRGRRTNSFSPHRTVLNTPLPHPTNFDLPAAGINNSCAPPDEVGGSTRHDLVFHLRRIQTGAEEVGIEAKMIRVTGKPVENQPHTHGAQFILVVESDNVTRDVKRGAPSAG